MELNDLLSFSELLVKGMATPTQPGMGGFMRSWGLEVRTQIFESHSPLFDPNFRGYFCVTFNHAT